MNKSLEQEINESAERIKKKSEEYDIKVVKLDGSIKSYTNWAWTFVAVGFLIGVIGLILFLFGQSKNYSLNLLGDFYGGTVASLWSLAGLFLIYVAFLGQKQQLLNQQIEIMYSQLEVKYTRMELEGQKDEMKKQNDTLSKQRFENTFFNLIRNHNSITSFLYLLDANVEYKGRDVITRIYREFLDSMQLAIREIGINFKTREDVYDHRRLVLQKYFDTFNKYEQYIGHYLKSIVTITRLAAKADAITQAEREDYYSIIKSQVTSYEIALLYYHLNVGQASHEKELFDKLLLGASLNSALLPDINHSYIFDPDHVIDAAVSLKNA